MCNGEIELRQYLAIIIRSVSVGGTRYRCIFEVVYCFGAATSILYVIFITFHDTDRKATFHTLQILMKLNWRLAARLK